MGYIWKHQIGNVLLTWGGKLQRVYDYSKGTLMYAYYDNIKIKLN